ncbi:MAG: hypothetical protein QOF01_1135 [Thermomicrobiales bacterium]|jgi:cell wall-associated NlpC family hydrolase|nr:hypothetical protein [Thermomicrobiales bacterium]
MTGGSRRARLGARLPHLCGCWSPQGFVAVLIAGLLLGPSAAFAQDYAPDAETPEASVRARAVDDRADEAPSSDDGNAVYAVAARDMPVDDPTPPRAAGETIAALALQYAGYPYVWAGNTPAGFDCSGFTQFVVLNTLGIDIGHGLEGQPGAGAWVEYGAWLPGDLIFFQNTYKDGLSHAAIYIGDGQIVHAENEGTGVVIGSLYSDYFGPRYWGAVRVAS